MQEHQTEVTVHSPREGYVLVCTVVPEHEEEFEQTIFPEGKSYIYTQVVPQSEAPYCFFEKQETDWFGQGVRPCWVGHVVPGAPAAGTPRTAITAIGATPREALARLPVPDALRRLIEPRLPA